MTDIRNGSNVGVPGLFVYRVDLDDVIEPHQNFSQGKPTRIPYLVRFIFHNEKSLALLIIRMLLISDRIYSCNNIFLIQLAIISFIIVIKL